MPTSRSRYHSRTTATRLADQLPVVVWSGVLVLVWVASLTTVTWQEIAVAAVVAVPCAIMARRAGRVVSVRWHVRCGWLRGLWRLPVAVLGETLTVWRAAAHRRSGELRELRLGHERSRARQAIAVLLLCATPGMFRSRC